VLPLFMVADLEHVLKALDGIAARWPHAVSFLFERARLLDTMGRYVDAEEGYRTVLLLDRHHFRALNDLGLLYHRHRLTNQAELCLRAAAIADPKNIVGATNLGLVLLEYGQLEAAKGELERAIALRPD